MAAINANAIRELRERTQAGMSDCKGALTEAEGDMEKAVEIILKKGLAKSAKRASAVAAEGEVRASVSADGRTGTVIEVNIQTDFAARSDGFQQFLTDIMAAASAAPFEGELGAVLIGGRPAADVATELTGKIGEKVAPRRWDRLALAAGTPGLVQAYTHMGGKIGVLVSVETGNAEAEKHAEVLKFAEDTAMQIAAMNPSVLNRDEVSADTVEKQKEIFLAQLRDDPKPKPEASWPKIVEGKVNKWFSEVVLLEQESVVVPGKTITQLAAEVAKAVGTSVKVGRFVRFERGDGIQKVTSDFADEVAKMAAS